MTRKNIKGAKKRTEMKAEKANMPSHLENLGIPWVDFVAAGTSIHENRKIAWFALETMHGRLLKFAVSPRIKSTNSAWLRDESTLAQVVYNVFQRIREEAEKSSMDNGFSNLNISKSRTEAGSAIGCVTNCAIVDAADILILSWDADSAEAQSNATSPEVSHRHFNSFDDLLECIFSPVRYYFSPGWFLDALSFLKGYSSFLESNPGQPYIHPKDRSKLPSQVAAQLIRDRLIAFGWVGPHLAYVMEQTVYGKRDKKGRYTSKSFTLDREGIHVLDIDGASFIRERPLNISNIREDELNLHYASSHPIDRAILAIEFTGYGNRSIKNERLPLDNYFLYQLPQSAVGLLCGIFPTVTTKVVTYRQPDSGSRLSAIVDRLVRLYGVTPNDGDLTLTLKQLIKHLVYVSIDRPAIQADGISPSEIISPFQDVLVLNRLLKDYIGDGNNTFTHIVHDEFSGMESSIDLIQSLASSCDEPQLDAILTGLHVCGEILKIDAGLMEDLSSLIEARSKKRSGNKIYKAVDRFVRQNKDLFEDLPFSGKSHTRPLTIMRYIAKFMQSIMQHEVVVHDKLQKWISNNFKFIWLIPHDPMNSLRESLTLNRGEDCAGETERDKNYVLNISRQKFWESHFRSGNYNMLFSPSHVEGSIEVDLEPIIDFGLRSLRPPDQHSDSGWMRMKIMQTQSLLEELAIRTGYYTDFAVGNLLHLDQIKDPNRACLELLPTSTILRCVVSLNGGEKILHDWCQLLLSLFYADLKKEKTGREEIIDMESQPQLIQFQDVYGMVGAALDCCRNKNSDTKYKPQHGFKVYFRPDTYLKYFRIRSRAEKERHVHYTKPDKANPYQSLIDFIPNKKYNVEHAIYLIDLLKESSEFHFGESINHLFVDIRDDLNAVGNLNRETSMRVDYLLKKYHMTQEAKVEASTGGSM